MSSLAMLSPGQGLMRSAPPRLLSKSTSVKATPLSRHCNFCTSVSVQSTNNATSTSSGNWKVAKVPHRGVLQVSGRDTVKLLQGLVSQDVRSLETAKAASSSQGSTRMVYAAFMNPQGRMLADAFIHRQSPLEDGSPRWLLDVDSRTLPSLLSFIKKFKLRSKVKLEDVSTDYSTVQAWSTSQQQAPTGIIEALSLDPRCPTIGYRGVLPTSEPLDFSGSASPGDGDEYTLHRIVNGVAEGSLDFPEGSSLPLENNLDYMNGVDFRKGCYVGQELTARTHHTGVVRKRIVPLSFYHPGTPPPTSVTDVDTSFTHQLPSHLTEVRSKPVGEATGGKPARGKAAGKFTTGIHNVGLGCLRLEQVNRWTDATSSEASSREDGLELSAMSADGETTLLVRPWIPSWWPKEEQEQ